MTRRRETKCQTDFRTEDGEVKCVLDGFSPQTRGAPGYLLGHVGVYDLKMPSVEKYGVGQSSRKAEQGWGRCPVQLQVQSQSHVPGHADINNFLAHPGPSHQAGGEALPPDCPCAFRCLEIFTILLSKQPPTARQPIATTTIPIQQQPRCESRTRFTTPFEFAPRNWTGRERSIDDGQT